MKVITCAILAALISCPATKAGIVAFDNFGPDWSYDAGQGWHCWGYEVDMDPDPPDLVYESYSASFVSSATGIVTDLWVPYHAEWGEYCFSLRVDSGGTPYGSIMQTFGLNHIVETQGDVRHYQVTGTAQLDAGVRYWLEWCPFIWTAPDITWYLNDIGDSGLCYRELQIGPDYGEAEPFIDTRGVLRVEVVPEPTTLSLVALGALLATRRRR